MSSEVGYYPIKIRRGDRYRGKFRWTNPDASLVDLTGYEGRMQIRRKYDSPTALAESPDDITITFDDPTWNIIIYIGADVTANFDFGEAVYDLELVPPSGAADKFTLFGGPVEFSRDATRV